VPHLTARPCPSTDNPSAAASPHSAQLNGTQQDSAQRKQAEPKAGRRYSTSFRPDSSEWKWTPRQGATQGENVMIMDYNKLNYFINFYGNVFLA